MHCVITEALRTAAFALQNEIATHKSITKGTNSKNYERDSERANECLKHVQLFRLNSSKDPMATRLATCPLQLGYADMDQWEQSEDCCSRTSGITSLADVLPERCRCGLISLKRRNVGKEVITPAVPETEWVGVLTHQLKEQALQRFLRGSVFMKACGTLRIDGHKTQHSMVFLDEYPGKQRREIAVRHHLCFICSEHMEKSRVLQCLQAQGVSVSQGSSSAGSNLKKRVMSHNEILSQGEFHVSLRWEGIGQVAICLQ